MSMTKDQAVKLYREFRDSRSVAGVTSDGEAVLDNPALYCLLDFIGAPRLHWSTYCEKQSESADSSVKDAARFLRDWADALEGVGA